MKHLDLFKKLEQHGCWFSLASGNLMLTGSVSLLPPALLNALKTEKSAIIDSLSGIFHSPLSDTAEPITVYSSSRGQRRLAYLSRLYPNSSSYNVAASLYFRGVLDVSKLEYALNASAMRHESAFTYLAKSDGDDISIVDYNIPITLPIKDLENIKNAESIADEIRKDIATTVFDLSKPPLWRMTLLRHNDHYHELVVSIHHYISDGWSLVNTLRDIAFIYEGGDASDLKAVNGFKHFAQYERMREAQPSFTQAQAFWSDKLQHCDPVIDILPGRKRPHVFDDTGQRINYSVPPSLGATLRKVAANNQVTIASLLNCVFSVLLFQRSQSSKFALGIAYSDRPEMELEDIFGFFVNWVPVPIAIDNNQSFSNLLTSFHSDKVDCLDNGFLPFDDIVKASRVERQPFLHPLFQYLFVSHVPARRVKFGEMELTVNPLANGRAKLDLTVFLTDSRNALAVENESDLFLEFEYNDNIFTQKEISQFIEDYEYVLNVVAKSPNVQIKQLNKHMNKLAPSHYQGTYLAPIIQHVHENGNNMAIEYDGNTYTYHQLLSASYLITNHLVDRGVAKGERVCWYHSRGFWSVAAMLACSLTGAIFTPVDMSWPARRRKDIIADVQPKAILCLASSIATAALEAQGTIFLPVDVLENDCIYDISNSPIQLDANDAVYLLFTSGSSGKPNGVTISHENLHNFASWQHEYLAIKHDDRVLAKTSFVFDAFIREVIAPLYSGAQVVLVKDEEAFDGQILADYIKRCGITQLHATPSIYQSILDASHPQQLNSLCHVMCGGEVLGESLVSRHFALIPDCNLHNVYGPTECTVDVTVQTLASNHVGEVPIGRPIRGCEIHIVDQHLQPVSRGDTGQIMISGKAVGLGYWNNPDLTTQRFVQSTFSGEPCYLTGDGGRINEHGELIFTGRLDRQVKVHGARVELDEIERVIDLLPTIAKVAIVWHVEESCVVAHMVSNEAETDEKTQEVNLRKSLEKLLPLYMVPARIRFHQQLPSLVSGKVDYQALTQFTPARIQERTQESVQSLTDTEAKLLEHAQQLLNRNDVVVTDNFFDLGGHSLSAVRFVAKLNKQFGCSVVLNDLFEHSTFRLLARVVDQTSGAGTPQPVPIKVKRRPRR